MSQHRIQMLSAGNKNDIFPGYRQPPSEVPAYGTCSKNSNSHNKSPSEKKEKRLLKE
jgi:hypothetical protein